MTPDPIDPATLDRLVDGELRGAERAAVLALLEGSPDGWRRCALAFLEAQCLSEVLGDLARRPESAPVVMKPNRRRPVRVLAWAAVALVAFGVGWMAPRPGGVAEAPRMAAVAPRPRPEAPRPPKPVPTTARADPPRATPPDYVRGRLEREGYRVEPRIYLVPASTRDGRRVAVPVGGVKVRYVGNRTL